MRKLILLGLSLLGLFDSAFLWWMYVTPEIPMVCSGSGCDAVRASSYAHLLGLPTPVFGVAMYGALALLVFVEPLCGEGWARKLNYALAAISGGGFLASLYLSGIEAFVLHNWCEWCVASAVTITAIFVLVIVELIRPKARQDVPGALVTLRRYAAVLIVAILAGVPAFILLSRAEVGKPSPQASREALQGHLIRPDSHVFGNPNSPVTVVEFGDFQCPFCGTTEKTVRKMREAYKTRVRFIFRQYPIPSLHVNAEKAAEASECAGAQGKFWEAFDKLYDNQEDLSVPALEHYAGELGLNRPEFNQCLESGAMAPRVEQDKADARALGVDRTPTFFVDNQKIVGGLAYDKFAQLLDKELASRGIAAPEAKTVEKPIAGANPGGTKPVGHNQSAPAKPSTSALTSASAAPSGLLGGTPGANIFSQGSGSLAACSEAEASERQPSLVDTTQARQLFQDGSKPLFVDVRPASDYQKTRIRGALNIPLDDMEKRWSQLPKDRSIILYESGLSSNPDDVCASGRAAGRFLLSHGFSPDLVKVYHDGLRGWEKAGLPVEHGAPSGS
jgi:protein-disulfide isomerase/rhodanese-related sulfurtransferase/uncharacterized membrane protein